MFLEKLLHVLDEMGCRFLRFNIVALRVSEAEEMLDGDGNRSFTFKSYISTINI